MDMLKTGLFAWKRRGKRDITKKKRPERGGKKGSATLGNRKVGLLAGPGKVGD